MKYAKIILTYLEEIMDSLLAANVGVILDILFFALLLIGILIGVWQGFIRGVCKWAGTIFSIVLAATFCVPLQASLEKSFGWRTAINNSLGSPWGAVILVIASFVFLIVLVKLACLLLDKCVGGIVDSIAPLRIINKVLGGILGAFKFFILLFILFAIFRWIPSDNLHSFIASSKVVGAIFDPQAGSWFYSITELVSKS